MEAHLSDIAVLFLLPYLVPVQRRDAGDRAARPIRLPSGKASWHNRGRLVPIGHPGRVGKIGGPLQPHCPSQWDILAKLARSVVRYNRIFRPNGTVLAILTVLGCALAWSLNRWKIPTNTPFLESLYVVLLEIIAVLRLAFLLDRKST